MRKASGFPAIYDSENGKEVMKKLYSSKEKPHFVVVKDDSGEQILGFIGENDIVSTLNYCQLNPEKC